METPINLDLLMDLRDPARLVEWCMQTGLINNTYICPNCGQNMKLTNSVRITDKYNWRCRKDGHDVRRSIRRGSWFEESKLSMIDILITTYMWIMNVPGEFIAIDRNISAATVVEWKNFCREVCIDACLRENEILGGVGIVVELSENKFGKRKYDYGKSTQENWVFAGIEQGTDRCFMIIVQERTKEILLSVIREYIRPGSTIVSDCWRTFNCLNDEEFENLHDDQNYKFKDRDSNIHTNSIESTWAAMKRQLKANHSKENFDSYLFESMWRRKHKNQKQKLMALFLEAVKQSYTPSNHD